MSNESDFNNFECRCKSHSSTMSMHSAGASFPVQATLQPASSEVFPIISHCAEVTVLPGVVDTEDVMNGAIYTAIGAIVGSFMGAILLAVGILYYFFARRGMKREKARTIKPRGKKNSVNLPGRRAYFIVSFFRRCECQHSRQH